MEIYFVFSIAIKLYYQPRYFIMAADGKIIALLLLAFVHAAQAGIFSPQIYP